MKRSRKMTHIQMKGRNRMKGVLKSSRSQSLWTLGTEILQKRWTRVVVKMKGKTRVAVKM